MATPGPVACLVAQSLRHTSHLGNLSHVCGRFDDRYTHLGAERWQIAVFEKPEGLKNDGRVELRAVERNPATQTMFQRKPRAHQRRDIEIIFRLGALPDYFELCCQQIGQAMMRLQNFVPELYPVRRFVQRSGRQRRKVSPARRVLHGV